MSEPITKRVKKGLKKIVHPAVRQLKPAPPLPTEPMSVRWGSDRGTPVDRYYIDRFIGAHSSDIKGAVLEIKDRRYTNQFGQGVDRSEVLDVDRANPNATVIADLAAADGIPSESYDCFILTETLQYIYDLKAAAAHAHRLLKPGGVLLVTVPCLSPIDMELEAVDYWRFTRNSCRELFSDLFDGAVEVEQYGNFASCMAWLAGLAVEEVDPALLDERSTMYVQGVCLRAQKQQA